MAFSHPPTTPPSHWFPRCMGPRGMQITNGQSMDSLFGGGGGCDGGSGDCGRYFLFDAINGRWGGIRV